VVIGASAGGGEALGAIVRHLPADLPAALFVVVHRAYSSTPEGTGDYLPSMLRRTGKLVVVDPEDGQTFQSGHMYVAPPRARLLLEKARVRIDKAPKSNPSRTAVDALFQSAASQHGSRVLAIVLSGMLDDGTAGLWDVRRHGGISIVQDPAEAR